MTSYIFRILLILHIVTIAYIAYINYITYIAYKTYIAYITYIPWLVNDRHKLTVSYLKSFDMDSVQVGNAVYEK